MFRLQFVCRAICASFILFLSCGASLSYADAYTTTHAPIGIMGDHLHKKGEWMVSFRTMRMSMSGNLKGDDDISDEQIVTTEPNRFAGMPMMPPTLRVVPQDMETSMNMLGVMYAPSDDITLMLMLNYIKKDMRLRTFQGGMGTNTLGFFDSASSGLGDTKVAVLYRLVENDVHFLHANLGLSLPTGSITEEGRPLTPTNMRPLLRLPYPMQLGSGTYDFMPGMTYRGRSGVWAWGSQFMLTARAGTNDEGYTLGNAHQLNSWAQLSVHHSASLSLGLEYKSSDSIDGIDENIALPVQTADPSNTGRDLLNIKFGVNVAFSDGMLKGNRFAFEYAVPLQQDVNGVQLEMDSMWTLGYQKAF